LFFSFLTTPEQHRIGDSAAADHSITDFLVFPLLGPEPQNQWLLCYPVETELRKSMV